MATFTVTEAYGQAYGRGFDMDGGVVNGSYTLDHVVKVAADTIGNGRYIDRVSGSQTYNTFWSTVSSYITSVSYGKNEIKYYTIDDIAYPYSDYPFIMNGGYLETATIGNDTFRGNSYADSIDAGFGSDLIQGFDGNDTINGGYGNDIMAGGKGDDTFYIDNLDDQVIELVGGGIDTVYVSVAGYDVSRLLNVENVILPATPSVPEPAPVTPTPPSPVPEVPQPQPPVTYVGVTPPPVIPYEPPPILMPMMLRGSKAGDLLQGGVGNDGLYGGLGNDTLVGGAGNDSFSFNTKLGPKNVDRILDFTPADDSIRLGASIFKGFSKKGALNRDAFWTGLKAHDETDRVIYDKKKGFLYYDADGTGEVQQVKFANVSKNLKLTKADFYIV